MANIMQFVIRIQLNVTIARFQKLRLECSLVNIRQRKQQLSSMTNLTFLKNRKLSTLIIKMESNLSHLKHSLAKAIQSLDQEDNKMLLNTLTIFLIKLPEVKLHQRDQTHAQYLTLSFKTDFNVRTVREFHISQPEPINWIWISFLKKEKYWSQMIWVIV